MNQKECINVKFSEGLGIFDDHYGYPVVDDQEKYNGHTGKVVDIQGIQAMRGVISLFLKGRRSEWILMNVRLSI